jgi:tetratricopeptide (TPR) repeat protein
VSRLAALLVVAALPWPFDALVPAWVDRVLYNPRERTETAIEAYQEGDAEAAARAADTALAVAPLLPAEGAADGEGAEGAEEAGRRDPRAAFNAGTAHLAAGDDGRAVELLRESAAGVDAAAPELAPAAHYNLGNALLADGDTAAAVEAFKESLRRAPGDAAAKHNLEVALRRLEQERKLQMGSSQETPGGDRPGEQEEGDQGGEEQPSEGEERRSDAADPGGQPPRQGQQPPPPRPGGEGGEEDERRERPLPGFEDQPDMTAEQAAAVLEAVENLERRQRQIDALERARREAGRGEKDW